MTIRAGLFLLLLLLFFVQFWEASFASVYSSVSGVCKKRNLEDSVLIEDNQCSYHDVYMVHRNFPSSFGVSETNGTTLERSLRILQTKETMYAAVLVYAKWCPFSRELRPVFETLSSVFPSIYHFSVEESALQPSGFSYYGVHSFPALFLHNKTARVRYHGSRSIEALSEFYKEFTGLQPLELNKRVKNLDVASKGDLSTKTFQESRGLHDDMFLSLSVVFLTLRAFFHILPKLFAIFKKYWTRDGASRRVHRNLLERVVFRRFEQEKTANGSTRRAKGKSPRKDLSQETGKVLLSVPAWSSSSLAAVALAEGSSSRGGTKEDI